MLEHLKNLPLTIVLTVLIWMYAEAQFTTVQDDVTVPVKIIASGDSVVRITDPAGGVFRVNVQGPKAQVEKVTQQAYGAAALTEQDQQALVYLATNLRPGGDNTLNSLEMLNSLPYFTKRGLSVLAAYPNRVQVEVDKLVRVSRPVIWHAEGAAVAINPPTAEVLVPAATLEKLGGPNGLTVLADPTKDLQTLPPDRDTTVPAKLSVQYSGTVDDRIKVLPTQALVTVNLPRQRERTLKLASVPVYVSGPPGLLAKHDVQIQPEKVSVTVAGPDELLKALQLGMVGINNSAAMVPSPTAETSHRVTVSAYLDLLPDDAPSASPTRRNIRFVLPEGLQLREGANQQVEFKLVETGK